AARVAAEQQAQEAARVAADQQAQEAARVAAEQQAQEVARVAAEQQATEAEALLRNTYSYGAAAGVPTFAQAGGRQLLLSAASSTVLQGAIRTAVATLVAGTGAVLSVLGSPIVVAGVVVGVFVVAAAVIVGKNERSLSITTPLSDVMPIENLDIQGISAAGGVIELPYTLVTDRVGDKARVSVVKPDGHVVPSTAKVLAAKFDAAQNVFTVKMDSPSCTFTFTPMAPPGGDIPSSTTMPGELPVENPKYEGVSLEPVVIEAERLPSHQIEGTQSIILVFPKDSGLPPLLVVFSSPYGETDTTGEHSKRKYLARKAGGPVEKLDWRSAEIQIEGVELVRIHTARFGDTADNAVMIERLAAIAEGRLEVTDVDRRYYTHELRELQRYRNLGVADGVDPKDDAIWNSAHAATLEDYQLSDDPSLLYTREAEEAALKQMEQEYGL
ncbi:S-type pyocin domain-containing protein, partial [Pseudomonas sp. M47T1]|uniref:S-type pyocin domain-containing protein n=1 Tax=Pseudomonas sp. M47T1 TaxID=1179778 RepID=UPI0005BB2ACF